MRSLLLGTALAAVVGGLIALWPVTASRSQSVPAARAAASDALAQARGEEARARDRAAALDREATMSTLASERAIVAAAALGARVQQAEAALVAADAELAILRDRRAAIDRSLARERAPIARLVAALQQQLRHPPLLSLMQPGSIADAVHLRAAIAAVEPQIEVSTASLRSDLARSSLLERDARRVAEERRALRAELRERRAELANLAAAERIKARRAAGSADREAERALALGAKARNVTTLLADIQRGATTMPREPMGSTSRAARSRVAGDGGPSPYRLPVTGRIAPNETHGGQGLVVFPQPSALVVSPATGRVAFAGPFRGYGAIVIVEHANGWTSLVTGLGAIQVAVGQQMVAGSPLGLAPSGSPRIGLELRRGGELIDPRPRLP